MAHVSTQGNGTVNLFHSATAAVVAAESCKKHVAVTQVKRSRARVRQVMVRVQPPHTVLAAAGTFTVDSVIQVVQCCCYLTAAQPHLKHCGCHCCL
jgi:hypothetical protein